ncbi:MAU2 chromatid cohesion factor homolog isoform X2 [Mytilus galloprovincialis]|uniref:MAU2 chromatid cohesion factor homolog isoform X2 n=1 Tax=Mytilus galloprovincialis TaxID=29158 RepID=UPI003F7CB60B
MKMASSANTEACYVALLGLAENFRTSNPPNIKLCIHCLQSILTLQLAPKIETRTRVQLGNILIAHTKNTDLAISNLEKAWELACNTRDVDDVKFESASVLAQIYEQQTQYELAKPLLQTALDMSQQSPYWHCRILFQLSQLHAIERDFPSAVRLLTTGIEVAGKSRSEYTKLLFLLSRGMLLLIDKKTGDVHETLTTVSSLIDTYNGPTIQKESLKVFFLILQVCHYLMAGQVRSSLIDTYNGPTIQKEFLKVFFLILQVCHYLMAGQVRSSLIDAYNGPTIQKESLKVFFLILQVCHYLMAGQVKSVKPALKNLQQIIQTITQLHTDEEPDSTNPVDLFQWLPIEHMCVLVYLVTVMHSMQAGYMDKVQKYTDKALMQIEKLKMLDAHPILSSFQLMLLEHIIMCRLIMGNKTVAIQEIFQVCHVCQQQPRLFTTHGAQIHSLLGLYAMSMNCMEAAESQFHTAIKLSRGTELAAFINLNLAIIYMRSNRQDELLQILEKVDPEKLQAQSHGLKASANYVRGLQSFFQARYNEAKHYLRETLKMANAEEINRMTSCSLVLLGHIFLSMGNNTESLNMVTPAMKLAGKIPDVHVQLWASSLLKDLYRLSGDKAQEEEGCRLHTSFSQSLLKDHFQSSQLSEHGLIHWTEGACPFHLNTT